MRPVLILNPRGDGVFVGRAREAAEDITEPSGLADRLRTWYPDVVVRPRELSSEPMVIWYVYRDGRWAPERPSQGA